MSNTTTITSKVPFGHKVAFGVGMLANQMFPASLGIFMVVLVQNLGFPGWMWGIVYFLPRVLDAVTDPIMGFISDNTKSKWGRRRQYVILGGLVMGISFASSCGSCMVKIVLLTILHISFYSHSHSISG
jgi:GPH family glycoside/pentoside/hexuronide:cation symporter